MSEEEYQAGESCETAIDVETGVIELPQSILNMWYKYTATRDGKIVISSDIVYEQSSDYRYSSMVYVKEDNCSNYPTAIIQTGESGTVFNGQFIVAEGDVLYINVVTLTAQSEKSLSIEMFDLQPGESCTTPIVIEEEGSIISPSLLALFQYGILLSWVPATSQYHLQATFRCHSTTAAMPYRILQCLTIYMITKPT